MQINVNVVKWGFIAIGTMLAGLGTGFAVRQMKRDPESMSMESPGDVAPIEDAARTEKTVAGNEPQPLHPEFPTKAVGSSLWNGDAPIDIAGHKPIFYITESQNLRDELLQADKRIREGEYKEAALHIRFALEKGMEAVIAHNLGNHAIANTLSENAERCRQILGPEWSDRLSRSCKLLNGVVHGEPFYQNMNTERIMASYNTAKGLCTILRSYAN